MSRYADELKKAMDWLAAKDDTIFIGQAVAVPGTFMFDTLKDVPVAKRREMPVCEGLQMQMTLGLSLAGLTPISIFPRQNFLAIALGDLINMVDKMPDISRGRAPVRMIIRTAMGPDSPIHPGHQHVGDFSESLMKVFKNIEVTRFDRPDTILPGYQKAYSDRNRSHLLIEVGNLYHSLG